MLHIAFDVFEVPYREFVFAKWLYIGYSCLIEIRVVSGGTMSPDTKRLQSQLVNELQGELDKSRKLIAALQADLSSTKVKHSFQDARFEKLAFEETVSNFKIHQQQEIIEEQARREILLMQEVDNLSKKYQFCRMS